jgi:hypothetical protein
LSSAKRVTQLWTLPAIRRKHLFVNIFWYEWVLLPTKTHSRTLLFGNNTPQSWLPFWLLKPASEHEHAHLLPRLLWSLTVLLCGGTHRKPIMSITAVLLPFVREAQ